MRRLAVFADGTWQSRDNTSGRTNVAKLYDAVVQGRARDGIDQLATYDEGVGTKEFLDKWLGGAFGFGLSRNVQELYLWLVDQYTGQDENGRGDQLYLFGYSRGAYTVRSLAGLIHNVGILRPEHAHLVDEAYDHYRDKSDDWHPRGPKAVAFRRAHSREVHRIRLIGVWDTVGSLGVPTRGWLGRRSRERYEFHDVQLSSRVENAVHALAVDECREPFTPTLWEVDEKHPYAVEQTWFAGAHQNVGGGFRNCGLSDKTLLWMADHAERCGLQLDARVLADADGDVQDGTIWRSRLPGWVLRQRPRSIGVDPAPRDGRVLLTHQQVHPSVEERQVACTRPPLGPYAPPNLLEHLARSGTPAGQPAP